MSVVTLQTISASHGVTPDQVRRTAQALGLRPACHAGRTGIYTPDQEARIAEVIAARKRLQELTGRA